MSEGGFKPADDRTFSQPTVGSVPVTVPASVLGCAQDVDVLGEGAEPGGMSPDDAGGDAEYDAPFVCPPTELSDEHVSSRALTPELNPVGGHLVMPADEGAGGSRAMPFEPEKLETSLQKFMAAIDRAPVTEKDTEMFDRTVKEQIRKQHAVSKERAEDEKKESAYDEAIRLSGKFTMRGTVAGNAFYAGHKEGTPSGDAWQAATDKKAFKLEWATRMKQACVEKRRESQHYADVDETWGEFLTFGALVVSFGGFEWKEGVDGAKQMFAKCVAMGGRWVWTCPLSNLVHVYKMKHIHKEVFSRKWERFLEEVSGPDKQGANDSSASGNAAADGTEGQSTSKPAAKNKAKAAAAKAASAAKAAAAKGKAKSEGKDKAKGGKDGGAMTLAGTLKEAMSVKNIYIKVMTQAEGLIERINSGEDPKLEFARNEQGVGVLEKKVASAKAKLTPFMKEVLVNDTKWLKQRYEEAALKLQLDEFNLFAPWICAVQSSVETILKRSLL